MLHVIASNLPTPNPEATAIFLKDCLNFSIQFKQGDWWADNGSANFCLTQSNLDKKVTIQVQSSDFNADSSTLQNRIDMIKQPGSQTDEHILAHSFLCDCGLILYLFHELDEDERDELISLPTTLVWEPVVIKQAQRILRTTPIPFRDKARLQMTEKAEYLAVSDNKLTVGLTHAMKSLSEITPAFQHQALFETMEDEGIDASLYIDSSLWRNTTNT